jgi:hypothetical protein
MAFKVEWTFVIVFYIGQVYYFFCLSLDSSSAFGSGPGVGNLKVSGMSIRPGCQFIMLRMSNHLLRTPMVWRYRNFGRLRQLLPWTGIP